MAIFALLIKACDLQEIDKTIIFTGVIKAHPVTLGLVARLQVENSGRAENARCGRRSPRADHVSARFAVKMVKRQADAVIIIGLPNQLGKARVSQMSGLT